MPLQKLELEISVVICAYTDERWNELLASVESVQKQTLPPLEIIVVIDHNDALYQRACKTLKNSMVIENQEARGLSGARNSALALAKGSVIAFIDEDATASPDWLETLTANYQDKTVLGVGGQIKPAWQIGRPAWFPEEFDWVVGCTYRGLPEQTAPVRNLIGCNMSFRREVFSSVGGFRNGIGRIGTLPVGCEETELCIRARKFWPERNFMYDSKAVVLHRVPQKRSKFEYFLSRCYSEGLSKALISRFTGARSGLNSEWKHILKVLPLGVLKGFQDAILQGDGSGFGRAGAIISGLFFTIVGFLIGRVREHLKARKQPQGSEPVQSGSPMIIR
ncbi:MAG: glycosyltransferase [Chloroflexota bacterium]|nr:glycosyltransferase [Chloroflexota bacterium]